MMNSICFTRTTSFRSHGLDRFVLAAVIFFSYFAAPNVRAAETDALLNRWLESQSKIQTWSADFVQTRTMKSFARPLTANGHVWFSAPDKFHWELGNPPSTLAVRGANDMLVIYPRLRRVEKYPLNAAASGQWKEILELLETGFPRSRAELDARFHINATNVKGDACEVILEPKSSGARKMMPAFKLVFSVKELSLMATEMRFADGSTMRNDFKNAEINKTLASDLFSPRIPNDFKVVEPLKQK